MAETNSLDILYVGPSSVPTHFRSSRTRRVTSLRTALATIRTESFDLIIVERELEDGDGIVLAPTISRIHPSTISVLLTHHHGWATREAASQLGYTSIIDLALSEEEIRSLLEELLQKSVAGQKTQERDPSKVHRLSLREREILLDLATGATTEEIAQKRHNSVATIKSHLTSIYRKLEVRNRVEAVAQIAR